jgi:hypothetical protein
VRSMIDECPWTILHKGHLAWNQRSLLPGDFRPGYPPKSWYIVWADGRASDPYETPHCVTCGEVPDVNDLEPVETSTALMGFLDIYRRGIRPWPRPTREDTCWWCNSPAPLTNDHPPLCAQCAEHLKRY